MPGLGDADTTHAGPPSCRPTWIPLSSPRPDVPASRGATANRSRSVEPFPRARKPSIGPRLGMLLAAHGLSSGMMKMTTTTTTDAASAEAATCTLQRPVSIGVVSFINTLPLIDGLDHLRDITLRPSVPSVLIDQLLSSEVEVALCSSIDYQLAPQPLVLLPAGMLGCEGPTLTVRLYSSVALKDLREVYCDTDSHTSVMLMRLLLREQFDIDPTIVPYDAREHVADNRPLQWPPAMLLIGDKVATDSPPAVRYPYQLDLGAAWHEMTGLPFIFALWMARADADEDRLRLACMTLDRQRRHNCERIDRMIHRRVAARNWPLDLAATYLKQRLRYDLTPAAIEGIERFFTIAHEQGLLERVQPLNWLTVR